MPATATALDPATTVPTTLPAEPAPTTSTVPAPTTPTTSAPTTAPALPSAP
ncbi:PREDICTED: platelet glycoprotein Ib alpha chain-like, partial [Merops nubicus]|uniref:platelet glycoprotein Ib alpha chain-like n=1 Tax=Merops nubicus TaxID=57421 RepID=UPI0004F0211D